MQAPRRRTVLTLGLLAAAALLTACTGGHHEDTGEHQRPDPDLPVRTRAVAATDALLAAYDTVLAGPGAAQAAQLQPLRAELLQHRAAFAAGLPTASPSAASASTSASASPSGSASAVPVSTVAALGAAERQTAEARLADLPAASPDLARLLAAVSAADALHAAALGDTTPVTDPAPAAATPSPSATATATDSPSATASATASSAPSGTGSPASAAPLTAEASTVLQEALTAEHAAVYGYGVVGARLPDDQQRADARTAYAAHEARRDALHRRLAGAGASPAAAAAGYQLPFPVGDAAGAAKLAAHIETRLTAVYSDLVAALPAEQRGAAAAALRGTALQARRWGAAPAALPGIPEPAATPGPAASPSGDAAGGSPGPAATR